MHCGSDDFELCPGAKRFGGKDDISVMQINKMRKNVAGGGGQQGGWGVGVKLGRQIGGAGGSCLQRRTNCGFAGVAVGGKLGQTQSRIGDCLAMAGPEAPPVLCLQPPQ